jgi:tyrosine recombinase XerC
MLLIDAVDRFLLWLDDERNASPMTLKSYSLDWQDFFAYLETEEGLDIKAAELDALDPLVIRRYVYHMHRRQLSRNTVHRHLAAMKSFDRFLLVQRWIKDNPMELIPLPKREKHLPRFLNMEEMGRVLEQPDLNTEAGCRDQAIMEVLYGCGLRVQELVGLTLSAVNLSSGLARVMGKGGRERVVPMGSKACEALSKYLEVSKATRRKKNSQALFLNVRGGALTDRSVRDIVKKYCVQAQTKEILSPHGFRHSFATHLLDNGADLRVVQELLGHRKISSTQIYTHVSRSHLRKIYYLAHPRAE